jgi:hypothetical protein
MHALYIRCWSSRRPTAAAVLITGAAAAAATDRWLDRRRRGRRPRRIEDAWWSSGVVDITVGYSLPVDLASALALGCAFVRMVSALVRSVVLGLGRIGALC